MTYTLEQASEILRLHENTLKKYRLLYKLGEMGYDYGRYEVLFSDTDLDFIRNELIGSQEKDIAGDYTLQALIQCIQLNQGSTIQELAGILGRSDGKIRNDLIRIDNEKLCEDDEGYIYWLTNEIYNMLLYE